MTIHKAKSKTSKRSTKTKVAAARKTQYKTKSKSPKIVLPLLGRSELSAKIQWLIDLGGTVALLESVISDLCGQKVGVEEKGRAIPPEKRKNKLIFLQGTGDAGHWVFYDPKGVKMDPYEMQHQRSGSHQFCQTFSLIYACSSCHTDYRRDFFNRLKKGPAHFGDNIRVAVAFWRHMFSGYHNPDLSDWMIDEVKMINDELKNAKDARRSDTNAIATDSSTIDLPFLLAKLADIESYADQIAKNT